MLDVCYDEPLPSEGATLDACYDETTPSPSEIGGCNEWLNGLTNGTLTEVHTTKKRQESPGFYGKPWTFVAVENGNISVMNKQIETQQEEDGQWNGENWVKHFSGDGLEI